MDAHAAAFAGLDARRRRLRYRLWHRGTREMDLVMGRFADAVIGSLDEAAIGELERLADVPDGDLYAWISGACPVPAAYDVDIFRRLCAFHALRHD